MKWRPGIETVRLANLVDETGDPVVEAVDFKRRLLEPHVVDLAASIKKLGGKPANLPIIHRPAKGSPELVGGWDRTAAMVLNGLKARGTSPDTDGMLEVRAFEGTPEEVRQLRRDENLHRRQDRDRWLTELVADEARALAAMRGTLLLEEPIGGATVVPKEQPLEGGGVRQEPATPPPPEDAGRAHKWVKGQPNETACGGEEQPGEWKAGDWDEVTCPACLEKGREWKSVAPAPAAKPTHAAWCAIDANHGGPCVGVDTRPEVNQQAGAPPRPLVSKADKAAARKKVAEKVGTTPAAVKQAEQRVRSKQGETSPRKKHDDTGPALSKADLELQKACLDVEAHVSAAVVRLRNLAQKRLDAGTRLEVDRHLSALSVWLTKFGDQRKAAGL